MYCDLNDHLKLSTDPFGTHVKLLLKSSGSSFVDVSTNAYTLSPSTNVVQSSDVPFGSEKSMDGTSSKGRIVVSTSGVNFDPGTGNWTVEAWAKMPLNHSDGTTIVFSRAFFGNNYWMVLVTNAGQVSAVAGHATAGYAQVLAGSVSANTWTHIAWVRNGSTCTLYVGGTSVATASAASENLSNASTQNPGIGGYTHDTFGMCNGKIYDLRVTFAARYTANFSAPTSPFTL